MGHACMLSHSPELAIVVLDEADLLPVWLCDLLPLLWPVEQIIIIIIIIIIVVVVIVIVVVLKLSLTTSSLPTVSSSSTTTTATATTNNNYNYNRVSHKWQKGTAQFSWLSLLCFFIQHQIIFKAQTSNRSGCVWKGGMAGSARELIS